MQNDAKTGRYWTNRGSSRVRGRERRVFVAGMVVLICPAATYAAEWSVDPSATVAAGYESNAALTTDSHKGASETILNPAIGARRLTETSLVDLNLLGRQTYYSGNELPDTTEGQAALKSFVRSTERTRLDLNGVSRWDTLLESAVLGNGTGNVQDVDVGLATTKVHRRWREAAPSLTYQLTERNSVNLLYRITNVKFGDVGTSGLVDYQQDYLSLTDSYALSEANYLNVSVLGTKYRPTDGSDSDTSELLAGMYHYFSATSSAGLRAGVGKTRETMPDGSETHNSLFVLEITGLQRSELSNLEGVISRDVEPSGVGQSVTTDQLRVDWNRRLTEMMGVSVRSTIFRTKSLDGSNPTVDRSYAEVSMGLDWTLAPAWSAGVSYEYRRQKYDTASNAANNNGVFVAVNWAPPRPR
jgi:hypothetical protein